MLDADTWKWLTGGVATAAASLAAYVWKDTRARVEAKADKEMVVKGFADLHGELDHQRDTQAKIFDQIRDSESKNESRHRELLMLMLEKGKH